MENSLANIRDVGVLTSTLSSKGPLIDQFLESGHDLVEIEVEDKKPSYVAGMLKKRIQVRGLELKATAVSNVVYLEKA